MDIGRSGNGTGNRNLPGSSDPHVQEVVKAAHEELRLLMRQRADVMKRIGTVKQTIVGLANLFGDEVLSEELLELVDRKSGGRQPGFTKACRMVLDGSGASARAPARSANTFSSGFRRYCCAIRIRWLRSRRCSTGWWNTAKLER